WLKATYHTVQAAKRRYGIRKDIKLAFDEWNVWYPEARPPLLSQNTAVRDALFTALVLNALQRLSRSVPIACFAQTVNVLPLILTDDEGRILLTPQYFVFKLYSSVQEGDVVRTVCFSPSYTSKEVGAEVQYIDASAVRSGSKLHLFVVNRHIDEGVRVRVFIRGFEPSAVHHRWISGTSVDDRNTFEEPSRVAINETSYAFRGFVELPPHSVNVLTLSPTA
ncbi:MAG: alpha-L-arabinofuranosidase C-terminal domain-containing protein, partial [Thermofilaceae archaeon]